MAVLYPISYGTELVTLEVLIERELGNGMLPEAKRRHIALIKDRGGLLGIGDGWRPTPSNTSSASMKGQSFHQTQTFSDGSQGWVAIDFVCRNPNGGVHVAPALGVIPPQGSPEALVFGIHANVGTPGQSGFETWHGQPVELDGWQTWVDAGRPLPAPGYPLPGDPSPPLPVIDDDEETDMIVITVGNYPHDDYAAFAQTAAGVLRWIVTGWELSAWTADNEVAGITPEQFVATVNVGRTLGDINAEVTAITGVTADQWARRAIA